jgi:hypothetical protein
MRFKLSSLKPKSCRSWQEDSTHNLSSKVVGPITAKPVVVNPKPIILDPIVPFEILRQILEYCASSTLSSIRLVDDQLGNLAKFQLYRHSRLVHIGAKRAINEKKGRNLERYHGPSLNLGNRYPPRDLRNTINRNPALAQLIQTLDIEILLNSRQLHTIVQQLLAWFAPFVVELRLSYMVHSALSHLGFNREVPWDPVPGRERFARLERLDLHHVPDRSLPYALTLLRYCPNLHTLFIDGYSDVQKSHLFASSTAPSLEVKTTTMNELHLAHEGQNFPPILVELLRIIPHLEKLVWSHTRAMTNREWRKGVDIWGIISGKENLRALVWLEGSSRELVHVVRRSGGFQALEEVVVGDCDIGAKRIDPMVRSGLWV